MSRAWLACVLLLACSGKAPVDDPTPSAPERPTVTAPEAYACTTADDCWNSCSQGAVSAAWYQRTFPGGESCEDGCASKQSGPPRCEQGACVATTRDGAAAPDCTRIAGTIESPGPAHRCGGDDDCMTSCRYGAVNRQWYSHGAREECKDGCSRKGAEAPRCEEGICVAYAQGAPDPGCTQRSIWEQSDPS